MKFWLSLAAAILAFCFITSLFPTNAEAAIYEDTVRLHVLANSDSEEDQRVKLLVRDAILDYATEAYTSCTSKEELTEALRRDKEILQTVADTVIAAEGYSYRSAVTLGEEAYGTRVYEGFALPAGTYLSLQVCLGEATGQNWWCVLFPPLCLGGAIKEGTTETDYVATGLTSEQYKMITATEKGNTRYRVKFRLLEMISDLFRGS